MLDQISAGLKTHFPDKLVDELLSAHQYAKRNFFLGGLRLSAVEGGRFCEAAMRMLEHVTTQKFADLGRMLDSDKLIMALSNYSKSQFPDSIRLHIPRAIRGVYDIRSKRDAAHLADDIDPNLQDASLVVSNLDWILAEFVQLYHKVSSNEAAKIIDGILSRKVPGWIANLRGRLRPRLENLGFDLRAALGRDPCALQLFVELDQPLLVKLIENVLPVHAQRAVLDRVAKVGVADPAEALV